MYISNRFVIVCNIQIVIRMLLFWDAIIVEFFYLMVKSGKSFVKLDLVSKQLFSFCFIDISTPPHPHPPFHFFRPPLLPPTPLIWFCLMFQPPSHPHTQEYSGL